MIRILTPEQLKVLDREALNWGLGDDILMEQAGTLAAAAIKKYMRAQQVYEVFVVAGAGNNGADGLVVARHLKSQGLRVNVILPLGQGRHELFQKQMNLCKKMDVPVTIQWPTGQNVVVVDALLGIGLSRALTDDGATVVKKMNQFKHVIALDVPSGLDAKTGTGQNGFVQARKTLSFGFLKTGFFFNEGTSATVKIQTLPLSYPTAPASRKKSWLPDPESEKNAVFLVTKNDFRRAWPKRSAAQHKSDFGHAVFMTGWKFFGAALLSLRAAQACGSGYVHWVQPENGGESELIKLISDEPHVVFHKFAHLSATLTKANAIVLGSGCEEAHFSADLMQRLINAKTPVVLDAGALDFIAHQADRGTPIRIPAHWILTPHPGEAARLLKLSAQTINEDRLRAVDELVKKYGCHVVLKGHKTVIGRNDGVKFVVSSGNVALAKGGSGDALAGIMVSLLAQKMESAQAAALACWIHGYVADQYVKKHSAASLTPTKLIEMLPQVLAEFESDKA